MAVYLSRFAGGNGSQFLAMSKCLMSSLLIQLLSFTCISNHKCSGNSENLQNPYPVRANT